MHQASIAAEAIAVCRITWAEAMAGMARRQREEPDAAKLLEQARQQLIRQGVLEDVFPYPDGIRFKHRIAAPTPAFTTEISP